MEAGSYKDDEEFRDVKSKSDGAAVSCFPLPCAPSTRTAEIACYTRATPKIPNPRGKHLPKIDSKTNTAAMRSWKIYTATIDEDRKRIWDNPEYKRAQHLVTPIEVVDKLLRSGDRT